MATVVKIIHYSHELLKLLMPVTVKTVVKNVSQGYTKKKY